MILIIEVIKRPLYAAFFLSEASFRIIRELSQGGSTGVMLLI